ncbi:hypothetical protein E4F39_10635 [Burkholderia pseudomallei]|nr:hypothetical protein BURPSS13_P1310 [Burkholderia pseudomallei S13]MPT62547.1 hypothetical protein [Burkholderia pseudomallei]MPT69537.1 hypothetical protein [Burkholderia pseudomallei]MPT76043.1 hypothetical protein [Burkholderia pseudomallei]MPT83917.1 hypothetical protein [Burkholderia pseudomallei]
MVFMIYLGDVKQSVDIINRNIRNSNQFEISETEGRHPIFAAHKKGTNAQPIAPRPDDDARAALLPTLLQGTRTDRMAKIAPAHKGH